MATKVYSKKKGNGSIPLLIAGIGIGCLIGLSVSPIIGGVVTVVVGLAAAVVTALGSLKDESIGDDKELTPNTPLSGHKINPWPLTTLVVGLVLGSIIGILARNNHWLGSDVSSEIEKWRAVGIDSTVARDALFEASYPQLHSTRTPSETLETIKFWTDLNVPKDVVVQKMLGSEFDAKTSDAATTNPINRDERIGTFLFSMGSAECESLLAITKRYQANGNDEEFKASLNEASVNDNFKKILTIVSDSTSLQRLIDEVLCINAT